MTALDRPVAAPAPSANGTSSRAQELADLLRSRRGRLRPVDVGLPAGGRRRTRGLRREEVAHLASISTTYTRSSSRAGTCTPPGRSSTHWPGRYA